MEILMAASALSVSMTSKYVFRVLPAGLFKANDGRPGNGSWLMTPEIGQKLIRAADEAPTDFPIDYEHQMLQSATNGAPAPAAGWFKKLEWRPDGLYVIDARWTERAKAMIDQGEYRFISPVFTYEKTTLEVLALGNISLTNTPALPTLTDLASLSRQGGANADQNHDHAALADLMRRTGMTLEQIQTGLYTEEVDPAPGRTAEAMDNMLRQVGLRS